MSQFSNYGENKFADFTRAQTTTLPSSWYLALGSAASDSSFTEITGTGYAREAVTRSLANWAGTQAPGSTLASSGTSHTTSNNNDIDWGIAGSAWGSATHLGFFDASTAGNCWMWVELDTPMTIGDTDPVVIPEGDVEFTLGLSGGMSDYLSNKLIDFIFRGQAYTWPTSVYAALYVAPPSNAGGGTEVSGGSYARVQIIASLGTWSGTQSAGSVFASSGSGGRISNNGAITFPTPTADWGLVTHTGLKDAATGGNLLWWAALPNPKTIVGGATTPSFLPNALGITFA